MYNYQFSIINSQLSILNYQFSIIKGTIPDKRCRD